MEFAEQKNPRGHNESIRILKPEDAIDRFDWLKAEELAREYTCLLDWVKRGFEASRRLGISPEHFIDKYIRKLNIPKDVEFETVLLNYLTKNATNEGDNSKIALKHPTNDANFSPA